MSTLVRSARSGDDDLDRLRARMTELETLLVEREAEFSRIRAELGAFKAGYRRRVGILHEQLDDLEFRIAEAELGIAEHAAQREGRGPGAAAAAGDRPSALPKLTSDAVRKLFRDVARIIHPDLGVDDDARDRRHALMIEANRAYEMGDEERLRWILQAWENHPDTMQGGDADALRERLARRIAHLEEQLAVCDGNLAELKESSIWSLKALVDEAAGQGKDLIGDMVARLKRDILVATNRLEAIRPPD
ncbi:MAG: hypothetical protein AB7P67_12710 [Vicinamibacterales bacterium]